MATVVVDVGEQKRLNAIVFAHRTPLSLAQVGSPFLPGNLRLARVDNGDAWNYFTHDQARSRAYRWGEEPLWQAGHWDVAGCQYFNSSGTFK